MQLQRGTSVIDSNEDGLLDADALLNGINLNAVRHAQQEMRADPDGAVARPTYAATVSWESGYRTKTLVGGGRIVEGDEPVIYGGAGRGATPQDLLLAAVGHCLSATYVGGLSAAGIHIRSLKVHVSGKVNFLAAYGVEPGQAGFDRIKIDVDIDADASKATIESLLAKLFPSAPIPDTIIRPVPVEVAVWHVADGSETI
jgi:uncharacterized OsmC-like protein